MKRTLRFFVGLVLVGSALFMSGGTSQLQAGNAFSSLGGDMLPAAPFSNKAFYRIDDAISALTLGEAMGLCGKDRVACYVQVSKEMNRSFQQAGYSLDKSVYQITKSKERLFQVQTSKWRDTYIYVIEAANGKKSAKALLKEGILSEETIKQVQKLMKEIN